MTGLFFDQWLWLIFIAVGLLLVIAEIAGGIDTGFDLASVGIAFLLAGIIGQAFTAWPAPLIAFSLVSVAYVAIGRRYIKRWVQTRDTKTNVDALMGMTALVVKAITKHERGRVMLNGMVWRASAGEDIGEGTEVTITAVRGATLVVRKQGGDQS